MKSSIKNLIVLGFIIFLSNIIILNNKHLDNRIECEIKKHTNLNLPKESEFYFESFIHIDGNWSAAIGKSWFSGAGSLGNPYIIENINIDASSSPTGSGIFINNYKDSYFIIKNCIIYNAGSDDYDAGIKLENSNKGTLLNNNCSENSCYGILLYNECDNNTILGNIVNNNTIFGILLYLGCNNTIISRNNAKYNGEYGIELHSRCNYNIISENIANNNDIEGIDLQGKCNNNKILGNNANQNEDYGIELYAGCNYNIISENTVKSNKGIGIELYGGCNDNKISGNIINNNTFNGIELSFCDNNTILENIINNNNQNGIYVDDCDFNTISENIIYNNSDYGIDLSIASSLYTLLYNNYIFNNSNGNGRDNFSPNYWDNGVIGNYWSDYNGIDSNYDGIGDTPYNVPGSGSNQDEKPIMNYNPFFFNPPDDLSYEVGTQNHHIGWTVITTTQLKTFKILRDGALFKTGKLVNVFLNKIEINVDNLAEGACWYLIEINDNNGETFIDGVWVKVSSPISEPQPQPSIIYIIDDSESTTKEIISDDSILGAATILTMGIIITGGIIAAMFLIYIFLMRKKSSEDAKLKISKLHQKDNKGYSKGKVRT